MRGSKVEPGVIPRAVHDLFQIIQQVTAPSPPLLLFFFFVFSEMSKVVVNVMN